MMRIHCLALAAAFVVTGCAPIHQPQGFLGKLWRLEVGPHYERPAVDTPEDFRGRLDPAAAASFADLPWWQVFDDPTLHGLVGASLEGNYDLQAAVARIDQARAQIGVAASQFFPQIGYQGTASRARTPGGIVASSIPGQTFNVFLGAFNMAWEIDIWGRIRRSTEVAQAQYLANDEARQGVVVTLVSDVASSYFQLLELDRELAIAHESAETYRQTLDVFTKRYLGGTDTKISTSRADAALQASLATIAALERQIAQQENAISVLLGTNPRPIERGRPLLPSRCPSRRPGSRATCCGVAPTSARPSRR
jgi:multidrug efflux system outer membrane protein